MMFPSFALLVSLLLFKVEIVSSYSIDCEDFADFPAGPTCYGVCESCHCIPKNNQQCPDRPPTIGSYDQSVIEQLSFQEANNPYRLDCNPFSEPCETTPPQILTELGERAVCGLLYDHDGSNADDMCPAEYSLRTFQNVQTAKNAGAVVTHTGACGVCSTTRDLAIYLREANPEQALTECILANLPTDGFTPPGPQQVGQMIGCAIQTIGWTPACAKVWVFNGLGLLGPCAGPCLAQAQNPLPPNDPDCNLNPCLQCDAANTLPIFAKVAGRRRGRSGILTVTVRSCAEIANIEHGVCQSTIDGVITGDCPPAIPSSGQACDNPGQVCGYGTTECCGNTYSANDAICMTNGGGSTWGIVPNDICLGGCNGDVDMDPHFRSWSGKWFDYHGVCDMMFLQSSNFGDGKGLRIHIRTKDRYEYSYIETAAVQIASDILEINSFGEYSLNGITSAKLEGIKLGGSFPVIQTIQSEKHSFFNITISEKEQIVLSNFKDMVGVHLKGASFANFGDSVGLMGNYTTGVKLGREGVPLLDDEPSLFGQEWQVLQSEPNLFRVVREPQHPVACAFPTKTTTVHRLGSAVVSKEQAEAACAHWDAVYRQSCVMDVLGLQDLDAAKAGRI